MTAGGHRLPPPRPTLVGVEAPHRNGGPRSEAPTPPSGMQVVGSLDEAIAMLLERAQESGEEATRTRVIAEQAARHAHRTEAAVLRLEGVVDGLARQQSELAAVVLRHEASDTDRRRELREVRDLIGEPPRAVDLQRASIQDATPEDIERWEQGYGVRGQVALVMAQMRHDAAAQRRALTVVGVLALLVEPILAAAITHGPAIVRALTGG